MFDRRQFLAQAGLAAPLWWSSQTATAAAEPQAQMLVHGRVPHNAEPRLARLVESWITPNELFYVRSHAPVPQIDLAGFRLSVTGLVDRPLQLSLDQLRQSYARRRVVATMTCAGNRRSEHSLVKPVGGVPWQAGAIGNAEWSGISLADVLKEAGVQPAATHVWFEGLDQIQRSGGVIPFGASIPIGKAMSQGKSMPPTLIADRMNGQPLPPDHGFPLRTVVPGYIGARSVKWLGRIVVGNRPSTNHYVAKAYKLVTGGSDDEWSAAPPIESFVINAVTCFPQAATKLKPGKTVARGYALAAGHEGRVVSQVELSTDEGRTWTSASFLNEPRPFCWRLWRAELELTPASRQLIVRATDSAGQKQPSSVPWNMKGYLFNGWHKTPLNVQPS